MNSSNPKSDFVEVNGIRSHYLDWGRHDLTLIFLNDLRQRSDELELEAPVVPEGIYRRIEQRYANVIFAEKVASLVIRTIVWGHQHL